jgi:hypothetical protein
LGLVVKMAENEVKKSKATKWLKLMMMKDDCESVPIDYSRWPVPTRREKIQISFSTAKQNTQKEVLCFLEFPVQLLSAFVCGVEFVKFVSTFEFQFGLVLLCVPVFDTHCNVIRLEDGLPSR